MGIDSSYKNGYRVNVRMTSPTGTFHRVTKTFKSKKEAIDFERETIVKIKKGLMEEGGNIKLSDYLDRWLKVRQSKVSVSTFNGYKYVIKRITKELGKVKVEKLRVHHIADFFDDLTLNGAKPNTIKNTYMIFRQAIRDAWKRDMIATDLFKKVDKPRFKKNEVQIMSNEDVDRFRTMLAKKKQSNDFLYTQNYIFFNLALDTGMRRGEIAGLKWEDIDLDKRQITVNRNIVMDDKQQVWEKLPKNNKKRFIDIDMNTVKYLKEYKAELNKLLMEYSLQEVRPVLFPNLKTGDWIEPYLWTNRFKYYMRLLNIKGQRLHNLRHTHISTLLNNGFDLMYVSARAGHSDISTTSRIYAHFMPTAYEGYYEKMLAKTGLQISK